MTEMTMEPRMGLNFEQVWAALMELREAQKETDRQLKESNREAGQLLKEVAEAQKETDRRMQETDKQMKETDKKIEELAKNIGGLNNSLGKLIEQMFSAQVWKKFDALGYEFTKGGRDIEFREGKRAIAEVDVFLENGEYAMPVEVKVHLEAEDVNKHIERIEQIRGYMDKRGDKRLLVGSVAGGIVSDKVRRYAQSLGLYVLEQSGDSVLIAEMPEGFTARTW